MQILTCLIPYETSSSTLHPDPNESPNPGFEKEHSLTAAEYQNMFDVTGSERKGYNCKLLAALA